LAEQVRNVKEVGFQGAYLCKIACDPAGSRALEAALSSTTVPLKVCYCLRFEFFVFVSSVVFWGLEFECKVYSVGCEKYGLEAALLSSTVPLKVPYFLCLVFGLYVVCRVRGVSWLEFKIFSGLHRKIGMVRVKRLAEHR